MSRFIIGLGEVMEKYATRYSGVTVCAGGVLGSTYFSMPRENYNNGLPERLFLGACGAVFGSIAGYCAPLVVPGVMLGYGYEAVQRIKNERNESRFY